MGRARVRRCPACGVRVRGVPCEGVRCAVRRRVGVGARMRVWARAGVCACWCGRGCGGSGVFFFLFLIILFCCIFWEGLLNISYYY